MARPSDSAFIIELSGEVFEIYGPYGGIIARWLESGITTTLIGTCERRRVGFAMFHFSCDEMDPQRDSELIAIAVKPEKQRSGIGQQLIKALEGQAIDRGIRRIFLHTARENTAARKLFIRNGYQACGVKKYFYPSGQDALMMFKNIGKSPVSRRE